MIRLLEVLATLKRAGAETMVTSLVRGLDRSRFEPCVVSLYDAFPNGYEEVLAAAGVHVIHLGKRRGLDPRMWLRMRETVREFRADIVHTHSYVMRYTLPAARCAMVHTVHNLAEREVDAAGRLVHRIGFRLGVVPVAVAGEVARSFASVYGFSPRVIPNGIDTARFRTRGRTSGARVVILSVARLEPQKNPHMLVRSLPPKCELWLAGEGSLRRELENLDRVQVLGVREDVPELLGRADIFALASDWEGYPVALLEAMASGLPVVATEVGGVPEIVGDAGVLVRAGDARGMSEALQRVASSPELRAELGARAAKRAEVFDVQRMVQGYSDLFEKVVGR